MSNLVDYGDKLLSGDEITDDEKEEMTNYIS
jgi:hypothetical protein